MKIILQLLFFFLQPVFWLGIIRTFLNSSFRIKTSRKEFHNSIFPFRFELRQFGVNFIVYGIILSLFGLLFGPIISFNWLLIYEFLAFITLLFPRKAFPVTIIVFASIINIGLKMFPIPALDGYFPFLNGYNPAAVNYLLLLGIVLIVLGLMIKKDGGQYLVPRIFHNQRNIRIAGYPYHGLTVAPMFILIPGNLIHHTISFWPTFNLGTHSFSFIFLPILLGLNMVIYRNNPRKILKRLGDKFCYLGLFGILVSVIVFALKKTGLVNLLNAEIFTVAILVIMLVLTWILYITTKHYDGTHGYYYSETVSGVRIIGIEPNTPASKMNLNVGDIILDVNDQSVSNENEFYEALLKEPTYCHLRVKDRNDELKLTDSAIYNNSPHEIGIILFKNQSLD